MVRSMKKTVFTLNINHYSPEITALTFPFLEQYADKIGANFRIISERRFPEFPPAYEKLQIFELGRENDWNIYFDADALVHPDLFDISNHLSKDTVLHWGNDMAGNRWRYDQYFKRDGRHIGSGNWLAVASDWCLDLWHPLDDISFEQAVSQIFPTAMERNNNIDAVHLVDDYTLSRNIARFGLKFKTFQQIQKDLAKDGEVYFFHNYLLAQEQKESKIIEQIKTWELPLPQHKSYGMCVA